MRSASNKEKGSGLIALLAGLVVMGIIVYFMFNVFQRSMTITTEDGESVETTNIIEETRVLKDMLETRNENLLNEE